MSVKAMAEVWAWKISPTTKVVALALADHADDDGKCWPSIAKLSEKCCLSTRSVQTHIRILEKNNMLVIHERPGRSSMFHLVPLGVQNLQGCSLLQGGVKQASSITIIESPVNYGLPVRVDSLHSVVELLGVGLWN